MGCLSDKLMAQYEHIIEHDVNLLENVKQLHLEDGEDELGPKVLKVSNNGFKVN